MARRPELMMPCPLCKILSVSELSVVNNRVFYICSDCDLRFLDPNLRLDAAAERQRYDQHENSIENAGYQAFLNPLIDQVEQKIPPGSYGLDFGCGPGPVASDLLRAKNFKMDLYDPFFQPDLKSLRATYDFIICCEVIEHCYDPSKEIGFLKSKLKENGRLFVMTELWRNQTPFEKWYYQRDPTHVCFYSETTFKWVKHQWAFQELEIHSENLISLY